MSSQLFIFCLKFYVELFDLYMTLFVVSRNDILDAKYIETL